MLTLHKEPAASSLDHDDQKLRQEQDLRVRQQYRFCGRTQVFGSFSMRSQRNDRWPMGNTSALSKGLTGFALVPKRARLLPSPILRQLRKEPLFLFLLRLLLYRRFAKGRFTGCMWIGPSFNLLADTIFLASTKGVVTNHFRQQANQEKLETEDDQEYAHEE